VTGATRGLAYVSPKSGRAVSAEGAGEWADRLLPLPAGLAGTGPLDGGALVHGLTLTGFFLDRGLRPVLQDRPLPEARSRLVDLLARPAGTDAAVSRP
jgi:DNA repair protein RecO (recombination protein O)